jgi:hypothetical protein
VDCFLVSNVSREVLTDSLTKLRGLMCQGRSDIGTLLQLLPAASSDDHIGENEGACAVHLHRQNVSLLTRYRVTSRVLSMLRL